MGDSMKGTEVTVPHLAESLVSATIGKWLKKPGDYIEQYDVLCELITEKITVEMPSPIEGKLIRLLAADGETAAVGQAICLIEEPGAAGAAEPTGAAPQQAAADSANRPAAAVQVAGGGPMSGRYSPAVLKLAAEHRIELSQVAGTGAGGRVTRKDVEAAVAAGGTGGRTPSRQPGQSVAEANREAAQAAAEEGVFIANPPKMPVRSSGLHLSENPPLPNIEVEGQQLAGRGEYLVDVTPIRNAIASKMKQSKSEIPHAWTMIEVDVTNLVTLRNKLKGEFMREEGINLTYLAFLLKAVVNAIKDYPIMNSVWATDKIIVKRDINISLAVGTEDFLVTPVIKKADQLNIAGLAREIDGLTRRARTGKLTLDEMQGGTFTVNNTGSFGSILSYPVINYPQAAILSFESIVKRPVVIQDMIAVRSMVNLCLSLDHRILDGIVCGRFLQRVKENLESYNQETKLY
ncbi:2-oxoisovalerate dehydrogenase E2 component (dihydrolipoyl transacylase) [Paenibacillus sp. UNCCL117]|uniref:dihydrolipoamide acetyltransferase family protein n=1 Tax=unclassified Paenibacillus TaxID=185978 RepID=UPI00088303D0|nr:MULTISPECIES: dihydrolipoamide acetyltransferase family protein [unclassified Paenibacillus]SDC37667.1 2-oxoisovalerate dehydrogenase E2 component (dihydrolipoyl transacylase) [Paenibacillus sp. cl123]SFW14644.1 2-oxoisovalerate dehydrogenase E2 component (dihydrolipoyl transacylase) [Paenibacillus sp. UNCCL117]